jgi:hypothetical protein
MAAYTIKKTNGTAVATVAEGTINTSLDITLIGKSYAGYGEAQNQNFVYLLENFANSTEPAKKIIGQIWFDSSINKLKFLDNNKRWRLAGGSEVSTSEPAGLVKGDFWFKESTNQIFVWTGTRFNLVGPQSPSSASVTQMVTTTLSDTSNNSHTIIQGINNNQVIFTVSADADFQVSGLTGFDYVRQGITLVNTNNSNAPGQTTGNYRFYGTSTNSDRLGGYSANSFVLGSSANFSALVNFSDLGFTVGNPQARLKVYNESSTTPIIINQISDTIKFQTTSNSVVKTPLTLVGADILPGVDATTNLGNTNLKFKNIYAGYVYSTAQQTDAMNNGSGTYVSANVAATSGTIPVRTSSSQTINNVTVSAGSLQATYFVGTASTALYADLAENYVADKEYEIGTVVSVGGDKEVTESKWGDRALGAVSQNPAYLMNFGQEGATPIALKGRVPVKVIGAVTKGQRLVAANNGCAVAAVPHANDVFAIALESNSSADIKLVECVIL